MAERIGVFVDVSNIYYCVKTKFNGKLNYQAYLRTVVGRNELYRAFAYGAQQKDEAAGFLTKLTSFGYIPKYKKPKEFGENPDYRINLDPVEELVGLIGANKIDPGLLSRAQKAIDQTRKVLQAKKDIRKANWDIGLTTDVVRMINRVDTVVIGSADGDFAPLLEWIREHGCRSVVYACNISRELHSTADEVIEIDESLLVREDDGP